MELMGLQDHEEHDIQELVKQALDHLHAHSSTSKDESSPGSQPKPWVESDLFHSDPLRRAAAALGLANAQEKNCYPALLKSFLNEKNEDVLVAFLSALGLIGTAKTTTLLEVFLYHPSARIRGTAMESIAALGSEEDLFTMITPRILDPDHKVQLQAHHLMESLSVPKILSILSKMITSENTLDRSQGISLLAYLKGDGIFELLNLSANEPVSNLRKKTIDILANYGENKVRPILSRLTQDVDIEVSEKAIHAFNQFQENSETRLLDLSIFIPKSDPVDAPPPHEKEEIPEQPDPAKLDEELDGILHEIGERAFLLTEQGMLNEPEFHDQIISIQRNNELKTQHEERVQSKSVVGSVKKILGGSFDQELALRRISLTLEESYLELGMKVFEASRKNNLSPPGLEKRITRAAEIFKLLKECS